MTTSSGDVLATALADLAAIGTDRDRELLAALRDRVDTPGTGSVFEWDTDAALEALDTMDAAVFVLTADPPVSAAERALLGTVIGLSVTTFAVLNKADHLDPAGLAEASEFTGKVLAEAGQDGRIYPMSARAALDGGDQGFDVFAADFAAYLAARGSSDLVASAVAQVRRIAASLLDEVALTRRAVRMRAGDAAGRVDRFGARLAEVAVRGRDRLAEATRALVRVVEQRYADGTGRMEAALTAAADLRAASDAEAEGADSELSAREDALRRALGLLDQVAG